ncbi:hypothetical protein FBEOM_9384 [Fusarium beomiforme]|uniref:F-box domain-containing protein n=1 Tax=Fusarium beomiforme TaxID=44412 RepID=A0A9P5ADQ2_9HYPO|nr:hypothetical protein FBEOM_9384 [Fusarium beomiforme]
MSSTPTNNTPTVMDLYLGYRFKALNTDSWAKAPEDWDTIRKTCTYPRNHYYFPLLKLDVQIPNYWWVGPLSSPGDLGALERLPHDIITKIAGYLDVESFLQFRNVNGKAHCITTDLPEFRRLMRHAPRAVISLIRTGLSAHVSFGNLYEALTTARCHFCEGFGPLLFLPTCTRTCHECLRKEPSMAVVGTEEILTYGTNFPVYGNKNTLKKIIKVLDDSDMRTFKVQKWLKPTKMSKKMRGVLVNDLLAHWIGKDMNKRREELFLKEWLNYRTAACVKYPYLNISTGVLESGVSCTGCQNKFGERTGYPDGRRGVSAVPDGSEERDRCYTNKEFEEHFETCEAAQQLWMGRGQTVVDRDEWFTLIGGLNFGANEMEDYVDRYRHMLPAESDNEPF